MSAALGSGWLAVVAAVAAALPAWAANQDFTVVNRTGYPIAAIHVTEAGSRDWGNDVIGRETLDPGERVDVSFERGTRVCRWDLMVEYRDSTRAVWTGLNLCKVSRIALFWDVRTRETVARAE